MFIYSNIYNYSLINIAIMIYYFYQNTIKEEINMRKASKVLGIVGGIIAILISIVALVGWILFTAVITEAVETTDEGELTLQSESITIDDEFSEKSTVVNFAILGIASVLLISGILGIVGGILVKKRNVVAGILMILGGILAFTTMYGIIASILLILGGIFALVKDNTVAKVPA